MSYDAPRHQQQDLLRASGTLLILAAPARPPKPSPGQPGVVSEYLQAHDDVFVAVSEQGWVRAFNGHVDLGTGIQTALSQIVADELDVPMARVQMVLGHTDAVPNQGPTIASAILAFAPWPWLFAVNLPIGIDKTCTTTGQLPKCRNRFLRAEHATLLQDMTENHDDR